MTTTMANTTCAKCGDPKQSDRAYCFGCRKTAHLGLAAVRQILDNPPAVTPPALPEPPLPRPRRKPDASNEFPTYGDSPDDHRWSRYWDDVPDDRVGDPWAGGRGWRSGRSR